MGFYLSASCTSNVRLDERVALITGGNTGLGKATARDFYKRGARVILACRDLEKANESINDIKKECGDIKNVGELKAVHLDLSSLHSVRICAEKLLKTEKNIHLLINNAGVMMCPYSKTEDGYEMQFGTNHLGHFLLTLLLMPKLIRSTPARIVTVSSSGHSFCSSLDMTDLNWNQKTYSPLIAYSQSKLANILFSKELAAKLKVVYQVVLDPSYIQDKFQRDEHFNEPGFIRMRIYSRYTRLSKHQLWIVFNDHMQDEEENERILGYYCTCKAGARTLGSCAHVASVLWFLGFARHLPNVRYPWTTILDVVMDAANRPAQINPNQGQHIVLKGEGNNHTKLR